MIRISAISLSGLVGALILALAWIGVAGVRAAPETLLGLAFNPANVGTMDTTALVVDFDVASDTVGDMNAFCVAYEDTNFSKAIWPDSVTSTLGDRYDYDIASSLCGTADPNLREYSTRSTSSGAAAPGSDQIEISIDLDGQISPGTKNFTVIQIECGPAGCAQTDNDGTTLTVFAPTAIYLDSFEPANQVGAAARLSAVIVVLAALSLLAFARRQRLLTRPGQPGIGPRSRRP